MFRRNSSGAWVQRQRLASTETEAGDAFGAAVAIDKSMIVVGCFSVFGLCVGEANVIDLSKFTQ